MEVRPFKLPGDSVLGLVTQRLRDAWTPWSEQWLLETRPESVQCVGVQQVEKAFPTQVSEWKRFASPGGSSFWLASPELLVARIAAFAFGNYVHQFEPSSSGPSLLLEDLIGTILDDLCRRMFQQTGEAVAADAIVRDTRAPEASAWRLGSGYVLCTLQLGGKPFHVLLNDRFVAALGRDAPPAPRRAQALAPVHRGLGSQRVTLQLWAGQAQIELGELQSLEPGDVVLLDMKINEPMQVAVDGVMTSRRAYLGRHGTRRALKVAP